jgi:zinc transporter ZupT
MSDKGKGIATLIMCFLAAIAIVLGVLFWSHHYTMRGLFIGFAAGVGCTVVAYRVSEWVSTHRRTEVPPG